MRFCCLRKKAVINVVDGSSLGQVCDLVFDECTGKVCAIAVPGREGIASFFSRRCHVIPWCNICKIGDDVILVEIDISCAEVLR